MVSIAKCYVLPMRVPIGPAFDGYCLRMSIPLATAANAIVLPRSYMGSFKRRSFGFLAGQRTLLTLSP